MLIVVAVSASACRSALPTHPWTPPTATLDAMAARADGVQSLTAIVDAQLTRDDGQTVRLEGAVAAKQPDHLRLQLWKLGRTTLDLTVRPDGVWLWSGEATPSIQHHRWLALPLTSGAFYREPATFREDGRLLHMTRPLDADVTLHATIDRTTLTLREILITGEGGGMGRIVLDDYRLVEGSAIPMRWRLNHRGHTIDMRLRDIELNEALDARAFTPLPRAVRLTQEP